MRFVKFIAVLAIASAAGGCQEDDRANLGEEQEVGIATLKYNGNAHPDGELVIGSYSAIQDKRLMVVRDHDSFANLWEEHTANVSPPPAQPDIVFGERMVLAVFAGSKPSGGYAYEITEIAESDTQISVMVLLTKPGSSCVVTMALTQPYHMVSAADSDKEVRFYENETTSEC